VFEHTLHVVDETPGDPIRRLGALLHDVGKPRARQPREGAPGEYSFFQHEYVGAEMADAIGRRLKLANADRERVVGIVKNHMFFYQADWTDGTVRRFVRRVGGHGALDDLFALRAGDVAGRGFGEDPENELGELRARVASVAAEDAVMKVKDLAIHGGEVMRILGVRPSRIVGDVLEKLLERVIDDPSLNDKDKLSALVLEIAKEIANEPKKKT
jgi:tRNA nucleotidyltransferase (CCA-adding enzyme)